MTRSLHWGFSNSILWRIQFNYNYRGRAFRLDFIHLLVSPRRYAAQEYVKSNWKADFTYFPSAENKARFGEYFSNTKWIKSNLNAVPRQLRFHSM